MKRVFCVMLATGLLAAILAGCARDEDISGGGKDTIRIVTTVFPPYDFARAVAGQNADVRMLIKPGAEVHHYDPSPADIAAIHDADVFIYIGGKNEAWAQTLLESMDGDRTVVRLMDHVKLMEEETVEGMEKDRDEADAHGEKGEGHDRRGEAVEYDEHIWTSPHNAVVMINAIAEALCEIDETNADEYQRNAADYAGRIQALGDRIRGIVEHGKRDLLVFGDRFPFRYFADEFGLDYRAAFPGCSAETEASAGTMAYLIGLVKEEGVPYIYYIEMSNQNIAKAISEQTGAGMLLLHSCHNVTRDEFEAGETYLSLMEQNALNLEKGLN